MMTNLVGGIGLFLIGMVLLTDGLKVAAGDGLKAALVRFTGGPIRSLLAGAGVTALVQSSSATTLTTIGFVSAGLLTFPQAVGVIFGANLGTTSTAWLVAIFGLKLSVLPAALLLVGLGALLRLLGRGRLAGGGLALAGFGLIFVGIDTLQIGMSGLAERISPANLPGASLSGRLLLILIGAAMTVVMQSSSAAVATTLAAISTGTISLAQAAALVIGQNVGTTVTAGIASIGASAAAKRTALAHVLFNLLTAIVALALLPGFLAAATWLLERWGNSNEAIAIAAFQTGFNLLGVALLLPVSHRFAAVVTRLVPDRGPRLTQYLDRSVARVPAVAVETAHRTIREILATLLDGLDPRQRLASEPTQAAVRAALGELRRFLAQVRSEHESAEVHARHISVIHAADHLEQLVAFCGVSKARATAATDPTMAAQLHEVTQVLLIARGWLEGVAPEAAAAAGAATDRLHQLARRDRAQAIEAAAAGVVGPDEAGRRLDAMRWLEGTATHLQRILHHLVGNSFKPEVPVTPMEEGAADPGQSVVGA